MDDRGQLAMEGIKLIAGLAAGAIVIAIVYQFGGTYLDLAAENATHGLGGGQMNAWLNTGLDSVLPALFLGLGFFGFVAYAVYVSGRGY